jgi:hypothetical protein
MVGEGATPRDIRVPWEKLSGKHSSLFCPAVSAEDRKDFITVSPRPYVMKLFTAIIFT